MNRRLVILSVFCLSAVLVDALMLIALLGVGRASIVLILNMIGAGIIALIVQAVVRTVKGASR